MTSEIFFAKQIRNPLHAFAFFARYLQQRRLFACNLGHGGIAQKTNHLTRKMCGAMAFADEMVDMPQHIFTGAAGDGLHHFFEYVRGRGADQVCATESAVSLPLDDAIA